MSTLVRGNATEAVVLSALVRQGFLVLTPFGEGHPFDLGVLSAGRLVRIQCKTAWRSGGCLVFNAYSTDHGRGQRSYHGRADVFGVYLPSDDAVFLVPVGDVKSDGRLRLEPARNNQRKRIRLAAQYEIGTWSTERLGSI